MSTNKDIRPDKITIREIIKSAAESELQARDLYINLLPKVDESIQFILEDMIKEEQAHFELFYEILNQDSQDCNLGLFINKPRTNENFLYFNDENDSIPISDGQRIIEHAICKENEAMEQYRSLAECSPPGPIRDMFKYLSFEEAKHKNNLEIIYHKFFIPK